MAELHGIDLTTHLDCILAEWQAKESIYGYPRRKMYLGFPGVDFSVRFHDRTAATMLGPASGPHTQMVQNIILAFLGGGRIMELKTVQILDELEIPRPCIDVRNIGFNVEWSQELRLEESYREYVIAWVLLKVLEELEILGISKGDPFYNTIFDISVGYDLKGIQSDRMYKWLADFQHAEEAIQNLLNALPERYAHLKNIPINTHISNSVTLSTFHGCPGNEIESIVQHLIAEHGFHVIVKMNPTILGYEFARKILQRDLGYKHLELDPQAFAHDVSFDEAVAIMKRLERFAAKHAVRVGAKFTNTLVVKNNQDIFTDDVMYLSGAPLHVLSMNAMHLFRKAMGPHFHISFSAGINKHNFVDAVSCNLRPVTTCTDLLKEGGFTRMFDYLRRLYHAMDEIGCKTVKQFILAGGGGGDLAAAAMVNARRVVPELVSNPMYHFENNKKTPPKVESHLELFDCLTCNKCLPVCPNAANFSIPIGEKKESVTNYRIEDGELNPVDGGELVLAKSAQIANLADFCNDCGDCDTYCPEHGGPFIEKPRFFFKKESYNAFKDRQGFYFPTPRSLQARMGDDEYYLSYDESNQTYFWRNADFELVLSEKNEILSNRALRQGLEAAEIDMRPFHIMRTLFDGVRMHQDDYASKMLLDVTEAESNDI